MIKNNIEISGITSQKDIKEYSLQYPCKEISKSYDMSLPINKPDIDCILETFMNVFIINSKIIYTNEETKIFFQAYLNVRIMYVAKISSKAIHSAEFNEIFSDFLPIYNNISKNLNPIIFLEDVFIEELNNRSFNVCPFILISCCCGKKNQMASDFNEIKNDRNLEYEDIIKKTYSYDIISDDIKNDIIINNKMQKDEIISEENISEDTIKDEIISDNTVSKDKNINVSTNDNKDITLEYDMNSNNEFFENYWK